jgi:hypothetical protein
VSDTVVTHGGFSFANKTGRLSKCEQRPPTVANLCQARFFVLHTYTLPIKWRCAVAPTPGIVGSRTWQGDPTPTDERKLAPAAAR